MTTDIKLSPSSVAAFTESLKGERGSLDAWLEVNDEREVAAHVEAYARANVARTTAAKDAEIAHERWLREQAENRCVAVEDQREALRMENEALRAELAASKSRAKQAEARAERLVEALEEVRDHLAGRVRSIAIKALCDW